MKKKINYLLYLFKHSFLRNIYKHTAVPIIGAINTPEFNKRIGESLECLKSLKGIYCDKRCFIIGNGPSLTTDDLSMLKNEICFGVNRIYNIFDQTDWRPTYYCASDHRFIKQGKNDICKKINGTKLICIDKLHLCPDIDEALYINRVSEEFYPEMPKFSSDISKCCYSGYTISYIAMQIAAYMGFKEIILLGIDHSYSVMIDESGNFIQQPGVKDHFSSSDKVANLPRLDATTLAYKAARKYADEHDIKILNATRGGKLEEFERVDFDKLF